MCSLQLHHVIHSGCRDTHVHGPRVQMKSLWPQQGCRVCLSTHYPSTPLSMPTVQVGRCVPYYKCKRLWTHPGSHRRPISVQASAIPLPSKAVVDTVTKFAACSSASVLKIIQENHLLRQCGPAVGLMVFATWGLGPLLRIIHRTLLHKEDRAWKESQLNHVMRMYVRPVLLWVGVILICRALDPIMLSSAASQAIKQRLINFVRSLSTVLAFAYCTTSLVQQLHKVMLDKQDSQDSRSLGAQFVGNAVYTAVWIAALCLFMELLGFSTQKWLTAGGLGTVLITLAGREIFTNFLSSIMIHATRPFVLNEWIQTKIDGYEVSGTVEHVGWWSPTIVRGDDREAVHIPNHKFTVSVVRNLSQKSHWRIKTYFGISHLDVTKVPSIVADMRKVLAKHPQVEQRRLHRRVFFESISPENQALMILVSCFVKTPHFEEYLRVKEVILLDLLKVISHHHARLATPIRSVQRVLDDIEPRGNPFRDMSRASESRPYLLIEASTVATQQQEVEQPANTKNASGSPKEEPVANDTEKTIEKSPEQTGNAKNGPVQTKVEAISSDGSPWTVEPVAGDVKSVNKHKPQLEGLDSMGLNSKDITLLGAAFEKPPANIPEGPVEPVTPVEKVSPKLEPGATVEKAQSKVVDQPPSGQSQTSHTQSTGKRQDKSVTKGSTDQDSHSKREDKSKKNEVDRKSQTTAGLQKNEVKTDVQPSQKTDVNSRTDSKRTQKSEIAGSPSGTKNQLEENLVLGVALNGPKQTLPLDDNTAPASEQKELVGSSNGNSSSTGKDSRKGSQSNSGPLESR